MLEKMVIEGGHPLKGTVKISGSKNAALPILIASIMAPGKSVFKNVPHLMDIETTMAILSNLGAETAFDDHVATIDTHQISKSEAPWDLVRKMRASFLLMGAFLSRFRYGQVSLPGGCELGNRPIDQHLRGFVALGVKILEEHGFVIADAKNIRGGKVTFDFPTVGATENVMMAAVTAPGETVIENAAEEPEVTDLAKALIAMGAKIEGVGKETIHIEGVDSLSPIHYSIIPDRIEAGTFLMSSAITGGDIVIENCPVRMLSSVIEKLKETGVLFSETATGLLRVQGPDRLRSANVKTLPYPGFPTDLQAPFTTIMTTADGTSIITETIFDKRFAHVPELVRLGADINIDGRSAIVRGVKKLSGTRVMSSDLRNSASLILAGLAASGTTEVYRIYHLDRGYERFEDKLISLGACMSRAKQND